MRNLFGMLLALTLTLGVSDFAFATVSSVVQSTSVRQAGHGRPVRVVKLTVTASSVDGSVADVTIPGLHGFLMKAITNPGSTAPTDNYDIQIMDADDATADASAAVLMNRSTTATQVIYPGVSLAYAPLWFQPGDYTLHITNNSVNSATVVIWLYFTDDISSRL